VPDAEEIVEVCGMFASVRAVATLAVSVSNTQVFVSSFDNVYVFLSSKRLGNSRALRGTNQLSTGQVMASKEAADSGGSSLNLLSAPSRA
jgi:hypothetical protein